MTQKRSIQPKRLSVAVLASTTLAAIVAQLFVALPARACEFEGTKYQTGDTVGSYICMPDGTWQAR